MKKIKADLNLKKISTFTVMKQMEKMLQYGYESLP